MKGHKKISLTDILIQSPVFSEMASKVEQLSKLNYIVHQKLAPDLAKHCRVANLRDGILILTTTSPTYGHLLRFSEVDLLTELRADPRWCHLKSIKTHVRPPIGEAKHPKDILPKPFLSVLNAAVIETTASYIAPSSLQKALLRLSKRVSLPIL